MAESQRDASVILELHTADRLVRTLVYEELAQRGLPRGLFAILSLIRLHQPVTPTDLALESGVRPTTMRDMVNEMVSAGHVLRTTNPDDQRSHFLELTPAGEEFWQDASRAVLEVERELELRLEGPLEELRAPLRRLRHAARSALTGS
jgi:MarR family transcriptional regulator, transcriptional regulator for hemolysin